MVAGRVGASMAAEIGTMRVTEQIDALTTLSTDPYKYLVWPRLIAGLLMLPLLVVVADIIGVFGGYIVGIYKLGFGPYDYIHRTFEFLEPQDVVSGLVKAAVFGFLVALMGCYQGYHSKGGAQGVGAATTKAVVSASILILTVQLHGHPDVLQPMTESSPQMPSQNPATTEPKIRVRGLYKRFGPKQVLDGLDLDVGRGESVVVIGGSGTGKSVLLKCILGILQPDRGSIEIDGQEVTSLSRRAREQVMHKFGMLFQGAALFDSLPVWENVAFGLLQVKKLPRPEAKERAIEVLGRVGLPPAVADLSPAELSGGMQKRVGLARAIATQPEILFFDEPTTGLDPIMADVINELIARRGPAARRDRALDHPRPRQRAQDRRPDRDALQGKIIWQGPVGEIDRQRQSLRRPVHPRPRRRPDQARRPRRLRAHAGAAAGRISRRPRRASARAAGPAAGRKCPRASCRLGREASRSGPWMPGTSGAAPPSPAPP